MNKRIKVGIFFGGKSREREISFAGGRTVYDNLDKRLFDPIPIFVDQSNRLIQLHWRYLYQGTIRDFYEDCIPSYTPQRTGEYGTEVASSQHLGPSIALEMLRETIDFAFLTLHGPYGEDGTMQGILDWLQIPYSGSGILGTAIGRDKIVQKKMMHAAGYATAPDYVIDRSQWEGKLNKEHLFTSLIKDLSLPLVIKSPKEGSSIGVHILTRKDISAFIKAVDLSFFKETLSAKAWKQFTPKEQALWITQLGDFKTGIGLPLMVHNKVMHTHDQLLAYILAYFADHDDTLRFASLAGEAYVLVEAFLEGREFSCIVLEEMGEEPIALPPTEILKGALHFDYSAKYLPGLVRKETPMQLPAAQLEELQAACVALFKDLNFQIYARIDGILCTDGKIYLNDPNTTAGMNPSSFLFHQAAEAGFNTSQLLTFLIRNSLAKHVYTYQAPLRVTELLRIVDAYLQSASTISRDGCHS
jgi:D-alanine-D-alanine ligase